jgi:membrane associated rhomboid family serine protease
MVMPLWDDNPFRQPVTPWATWGLIGVNVVAFAVLAAGGGGVQAGIANTFGVIPASLVSNTYLLPLWPPALTLLTYQFLHFSWMHLFGNMLFLFVFGDNVEEATGSLRFLAFYLLCGVAAALNYVASAPGSFVPLGGASGAVAGVIGAYLLLRPCARITVLVLYIALRVRAYWVIGGWALMQLWQVETRANDGVAYWAHLGGLAGGAILFPLLRRPGVRLFECVEPPRVATS